MAAYTGIEHVLDDQFRPYRVSVGNAFNFVHTVFVLSAPVVIAIVAGCMGGGFVQHNAANLLAAFAIIASVMTAIMPTIHGLVGDVELKQIEELKGGSKTSDANIESASTLVAKIELVRSLYAAVAWSVILLVAAIAPLLVLMNSSFEDSEKAPIGWIAAVLRGLLTFIVAYAGATSFVSLLQIVTGVHLMIRHKQAPLETEVKKLKDHYGI